MSPTWQTGSLTVHVLAADEQAEKHTFMRLGHAPTPAQLLQFGNAIGELTAAPFEAALLKTIVQYHY
ncbi:hypothetical protein [Lactiplantibacillus daowaiensis]|uniref:Uncharacterized protein n=1 Tax=Lactiplantibacillus daowaiensis TaxID=2559918 RepID=A0ABW1RWL4_9LACO|nr:hypothetical protein [Lactiplantibacillus daowaiensis]